MLILICAGGASGQTLRTYTQDTDTFPNPERGLFSGIEERGDYATPIRNACIATRNARRSLVNRYYYFPSYHNRLLPQERLDFIQRDMDTLRAYGLKAVIKFGYGAYLESEFHQARIDTICLHMDQLKPMFQRNADVIAFIETGWIGAWGEWHSTTAAYPAVNNVRWYDTTRVIQDSLVRHYLSVLPVEKKIQVRTPLLIQSLTGRRTPVTAQEAHSSLDFSRIGFHNDAFISGSNWNDQGTWMGWLGNIQDSVVMKAFIQAQSKYTPVGGEIDGTARVTCGNAIWEGSSQHYSFLNGQFLTTAHAMLRTGGCWAEFQRRLGYRFVLDSVLLPIVASPGGEYRVRVYMRNAGFAAPVYPRKLHLVLRNASRSYTFTLDEDLRYRLPENGPIAYDLAFRIPDTFVQDTYQAYLWCPDSYPTLEGDPRYSVRFANTGVWDASLGMNALGVTLFPSNQPVPPTLLSPANGSSGLQTSLTARWRSRPGALRYHVQVADNSSFAGPAANDSTLTDTVRQVSGLNAGTTYYWRARVYESAGWSQFSTPFNFSTESNLLPPPVLQSPATGATGLPTSLTTRWLSRPGATRYHVQVAENNSFNASFINDSTLADTSRQITGLSSAMTYFWRVRVLGVAGWSQFSTVFQFATDPGVPTYPDPPEVTSPASGSLNQPSRMDIRWNPSSGATKYRLQLSRDAAFRRLMADDSSLTGTLKRFRGLPRGTTMYFRMQSGNTSGWGAYGTAVDFTTAVSPSSGQYFPGQPGLTSGATVSIPSGATVAIFDEPFQNGDEIAIFTPGGLCAGSGRWHGSDMQFRVRGDDPATGAADGLRPGDPLQFRIWRSREKVVYGATVVTFASGTGTYDEGSAHVVSSLVVDAQPMLVDQTIMLQSGWNMISVNCEPTDPDIASMLSDITPVFELLKDGDGKTYWPAFDIHDVSHWNYLQGYQINMQSADSFIVAGFELSHGRTDVQLMAGWNLVPYLLKHSAPIVDVLAPIEDRITIVKNNAGDVYWPATGINTIGTMMPGEAYLMYPTEEHMLVFSATHPVVSGRASGADGGIVPPRSTSTLHYEVPQNTGSNATLLIHGPELGDGDEIAVMTQTGLVVGTGIVRGGETVVTVWGDDPSTPGIVEGAAEDSRLTIERWNSRRLREEPVTLDSLRDVFAGVSAGTSVRYRTNGLWIAGVSVPADVVPEAYALSQNYPNPFNPSTKMQFVLPRDGVTSLKVYNELGVEVAMLASGRYDAGTHTVVWDAAGQPSGIYFARLRSGDFVETTKLMLVK